MSKEYGNFFVVDCVQHCMAVKDELHRESKRWYLALVSTLRSGIWLARSDCQI